MFLCTCRSLHVIHNMILTHQSSFLFFGFLWLCDFISIPFFAGHGSKPILLWQLSSKKTWWFPGLTVKHSLALGVVGPSLENSSCGLSSTPNNNMNIECHIHRHAVYRLAPFCGTSWHVPRVQIGVLLSVSMPTCGSATWMGFEIQIAPGHWHRLLNSTQYTISKNLRGCNFSFHLLTSLTFSPVESLVKATGCYTKQSPLLYACPLFTIL